MHARMHARTRTRTHLPAYIHTTFNYTLDTHLPQVRLGRLHTTTVPQSNPGYLSIFSSSFCLLCLSSMRLDGWMAVKTRRRGKSPPARQPASSQPTAAALAAAARRPYIHAPSVLATSIPVPHTGVLRYVHMYIGQGRASAALHDQSFGVGGCT